MSVTVAEDIHIKRELPDGGLIEFEERVNGYRAYWYTGPTPGTKRVKFPSVTTIIGRVMPKYGLMEWYGRLGTDAAKSEGKRSTERGKRVHKVLEDYCLTGTVPNPASFPEEDRGYIRALIRWILKADPIPVAVECLVCDSDRGYAGRYDLRASCYGRSDEWIVDLKSNKNGKLYPEASVQVAGYFQADVKCGMPPAMGGLLVAVGPDGEFHAGYAPLEAWEVWERGLELYSALTTMPEALPVR